MADMDDYSYLESLPFDLQRFLLVNYLGPETTACLRLCSSRMRTICDNDEIWRDFCCRDLHIKPKEIGVPYKFHLPLPPDHGIPPEVPSALISASLTTFYKIYTLLLHTFRGFLKRLLTSSSTAYGDLFTLSYDNGRLVGEAWFLSQIITDAMRAVTDFTIFIDELSDGAVILHEFARTEAEVKEFKRGDFVVDRQSVDPEGGPWVTFKFRSHFSNPRCAQVKLNLLSSVNTREGEAFGTAEGGGGVVLIQWVPNYRDTYMIWRIASSYENQAYSSASGLLVWVLYKPIHECMRP